MQCPQCGIDNETGALFCAGCGSSLSGVEPAAGATSGTEPMTEEPHSAPVEPPAPTPASAVGTPLTAPAAGAAPMSTATPPPPPPKKRGCLFTTLIFFGVVAVACAVVVWFVTRPPMDLGVSYTEADYQSAVQAIGIDVVDTVPDMPVEQTKIVYSGKQVRTGATAVRLSSKQVSAAISMHHRSPKWALADVQILLGDDDKLQLSGFMVYEGARYAFYTDLEVLLAGPRSVGGKADKILVFGMDFPLQWYAVAEQYLIQKTNDWLSGMGEGLDIRSATIQDGELILEGTFPTSARRVPLTSITPTGTPTP